MTKLSRNNLGKLEVALAGSFAAFELKVAIERAANVPASEMGFIDFVLFQKYYMIWFI